MDACHLLLGRPWQYDRKTKHDGFKNTYSFIKDGIHITLAPLDTRHVTKDDLLITIFEVAGLTMLNPPDLLFALVIQEANKVALTIPVAVQPLITEFQEVFPDDIPPGLPMMREIQHCIDFIALLLRFHSVQTD